MYSSNLDAIVLCPTGQDALLIAASLKNDSIDSTIVKSISELCELDYTNSGLIVVAEEALTIEGIETLNNKLAKQPPWSDIPIVLFTSGAKSLKHFKLKQLEVFVSSGNVTLLERPLHPLTFLSSIKVALRSRVRQYQVKDLLESQAVATRIRDEFISIASHELKTPLTSLKLQTQMTKRKTNKDMLFTKESVFQQLDYTVKQVDRLNSLVDDMLDISRINTGKLQINKAGTNLSELLDELITRFLPQFEAVHSPVTYDLEPEVWGQWDAYRLEQVVNNLFSNAIRYSPNKSIHVGLKKEGSFAIFNVQDNGSGIAPENLERIFERFERVSSSVAGLGLGLYITRQILEQHSGTIRVESELGKGSNFIITLPLE